MNIADLKDVIRKERALETGRLYVVDSEFVELIEREGRRCGRDGMKGADVGDRVENERSGEKNLTELERIDRGPN